MTITAGRSKAASAPPSRSGGVGKLLFTLIVVAALSAGGYIGLRPYLAGPDQPEPALPASALDPYVTFFNEHGSGLPEELSVSQVTNRAGACASGQMATNKPEYADADELGRARGGWVCLLGPQTAVPNSRCPAPGTNDWRRTQAPRLPQLNYVVHGHIIGKSVGGHGYETRNGRCVNMTPQSSTPNGQMGQQAERHVAQLAAQSPEVPIFYSVVPVYDATSWMPIGMWVFIISIMGTETPGPFLNEPSHIAAVGAAA